MKTKFKIYAALTIALCTALLAVTGCNLGDDLLIAKGKPQLQPAGTGSIVLTVNGGNNGRTIMPKNVEFKHYIATAYEFIIEDNEYAEDGLSVDIDVVTGKGTLNLHVGSKYKIVVDAYVDNVLEYDNDNVLISKPVATGFEEILEVLASGNTPVNVQLEPVGAGEGTFSWIITHDATISKIAISIDTPTPTNLVIFDATDPDSSTLVGHQPIDKGNYLVTFTITFGTDTRVFVEDLHIYAGLDSKYEHYFHAYKFYTMVDYIAGLFKTPEGRATLHWEYFEDLEYVVIDKGDAEFSDLLAKFDLLLATNPQYPEDIVDLKAIVDAALVMIAAEDTFEGLQDAKENVEEAVLNGSSLAYEGTPNEFMSSMVAIIGSKYHVTVNFTQAVPKIVSITATLADQYKSYLQYFDTVVDFEHISVTAAYSDGSTGVQLFLTSNQFEFDPPLNSIVFTTAASQTITVKSTELDADGEQVEDEIIITVHPLVNITLGATGVNKDYYQYIPATVNLDSLVVTGHWKTGDDGDDPPNDILVPRDVTSIVKNTTGGITGNVLTVSAADTPNVVIDYHGKTANIPVTIHALTSLKLPATRDVNIVPDADWIKARLIDQNIDVNGHYGENDGDHNEVINEFMMIGDEELNAVTVNVTNGSGANETDVSITWKTLTSSTMIFTYVPDPVLSNITFTGTPGKFYQHLTDYNNNGMTVTAHYTQEKHSQVLANDDVDLEWDYDEVYTNINATGASPLEIHVRYTEGGVSVTNTYYITVIALDRIEVTGIADNEVYADHPTPEAILAKISVDAVWADDPEHSVDIKTLGLLTAADVAVNESAQTIQITWHGKNAFTDGDGRSAPIGYKISAKQINVTFSDASEITAVGGTVELNAAKNGYIYTITDIGTAAFTVFSVTLAKDVLLSEYSNVSFKFNKTSGDNNPGNVRLQVGTDSNINVNTDNGSMVDWAQMPLVGDPPTTLRETFEYAFNENQVGFGGTIYIAIAPMFGNLAGDPVIEISDIVFTLK